jgi:acyl-CoA synthetase (AMP-forming)/AMP-acid ligase II
MTVDVSLDPFWLALAAHGDRPAVVTSDVTISYAELADLVAADRERLGPARRLVVLEGERTLDGVVTYLAALSGGHAVVLVPDASSIGAYDPDVVVSRGRWDVRREGTTHDLHPELALLMSTSGSTGSPKLVRLSSRGVASNAAAIADYLGIRSSDVAPTTLPLHYCYGLSVLHSHLAVGAAVLLTEESVTSPRFWDEVREARCTTLAGVPHTFELLDHAGFADRELPHLRYLTQAGGRMDPAAVRRWAELGERKGFGLVVMYGATEATARMAYLPPDLAARRPEAVGVAIPGGSLQVEDGEVVYRGENVMLGYAHEPADLARGREVHALRTGDLGRIAPDGLLEITGRSGRVAKPFGLRVDLDRVEHVLAEHGVVVHCVDGGARVVVAVAATAPVDDADLLRWTCAATGLPPVGVQVLRLDPVPRRPSGKPDPAAILALADAVPPAADDDVGQVFVEVLGRPDVRDGDSFVSLGGDSLSCVELSVRLERALGPLPTQWPSMTVGELRSTATEEARDPRRRRWVRVLETSVVLRALAIVLIVTSHTDLVDVTGGAHVLLVVLGFNLGRFLVVGESGRARRVLRTAGRIAGPAVVWLALVVAIDPGVTWRNVLLLNGVLGTETWSDPWQYWFIEAAVYLLLACAALLAVPAVGRLEQRFPFGLPLALCLAALLTRYDVVGWREGPVEYRAHVVAWLFLLGWAVAKAGSPLRRVVVSAVAVATVPGFFDDPARELVVVGGVLLLVWVRGLPVPAPLARAVLVTAAASLFVYLTHWQVYPGLEDAGHPVLATLASFAVGILAWDVNRRVRSSWSRAAASAA